MPGKPTSPADEHRASYLLLCEQLLQHGTDMRNYAMKPGNAWLARGELAKVSNLIGELESMLDKIKKADEDDK
jgi:hypothetical protein